tara:strand:+ start:3190 stop:6285 length:3096 start_codon:yes stop_codon:yes gene_type:complete
MSAIETYFAAIRAVHATGQATEHSYRPALRDLFSSLDDEVSVINEPKRVAVGAPDFIFERKGIPVGHCEAKDLDKDLKALKGYSVEQKQRYRKGFANLVYTNGLDFEFYREGELIRSISIGDYLMGVQPKPEEFDALNAQLRDFVRQQPRTIHSSKRLAEMMAGKAALIKDMMGKALVVDLRDEPDSELVGQYEAFKQHLIHDITPADFADLYAETIAYGLFAARLHDDTLDTFSRTEALELLPKSNPFLRSLFGYIAGPELDDRIAWIIDDLAKIFLACDLKAIMADFGQLTGQNDPFLHFYETFLSAYNPAKRKARGVWYTPEPVVNFIVRAVDEVLKTEFGLADGLADTSKVSVQLDTGQRALTKAGKLRKSGENAIESKDVHRVQILDPATGTGTFLAEVVKQIAPKVKGVAPGMWSQYIEQDLIPRLHGFELLMASYAMCHMKLDMILTELGYKPSGTPPRLSVYLTNSLEEGEPVNQTLPFTQWLSKEAKGANTIKRDMPIMCVVGNPPYLGEGGKSEGWLGELMDDYKKEPGGRQRLQERNPKWLNDLYVKFIRMSSHLIEKNGEGVVGFITNHGYLDNPTFRGMRWHLLKTFDKIWILDLHGSSQKKEVPPGAPRDANVFDIKPGVAVIIATRSRSGNRDRLAEVFRQDIFGSRVDKHQALQAGTLTDTTWRRLRIESPRYYFRPWDYDREPDWQAGIGLGEFMPTYSNGVVTGADKTLIASDAVELERQIVRKSGDFDAALVQPITYRPFERSFIYGDSKLIERNRSDVMEHYLRDENVGLLVTKQVRDYAFAHVFVTRQQSEAIFLSGTTSTNAMNLPLYLHPGDGELDQSRRINFEPKLYAELKRRAADPHHGEPGELQVFDYIYGVLHCPVYRETYSEFLKVDFPRIPWPKTPDVFWAVSEKGTQLRHLHLMEPAAIGDTPYPFEGDGDGTVEKPTFTATKDGLGDVWINKTQRFAGVLEISWDFYIGGYQPAQKWLKDRKGRALEFADIQHYQRIIKILSETDRIMKEIELPLDLDGE